MRPTPTPAQATEADHDPIRRAWATLLQLLAAEVARRIEAERAQGLDPTPTTIPPDA